jgi:exopolyphosphatase/guanosine-5'-triphosphate,3'-diphosphate pyrophosphatase
MIAERLPAAEASRPANRLESVRAFARKCRSGERHCEQVALLAGEIFDGVHERFDVPADARELLTAGALLHDIGYMINHAKHHKHAYHLILHGDLQGFTQREIDVIANVARYHRKAFPRKRHENFARLDRGDRRLVRVLAGILRVADGLDRTHTQRVTGVSCEVRRGQIRLSLQAPSDPRVEIWDAERKAGLLAEAFGGKANPLRFLWHRPARRQAPALRLAAAG